MKIVLLILSAVLLWGCSTSTFSNLKTGLDNLVDEDLSTAIDILGYPSSKQEIGSENIYTWSKSSSVSYLLPQTNKTTGTIGTTPISVSTTTNQEVSYNNNCVIKIITNKSDRVITWEYSGNIDGCSVYSNRLAEFSSKLPVNEVDSGETKTSLLSQEENLANLEFIKKFNTSFEERFTEEEQKYRKNLLSNEVAPFRCESSDYKDDVFRFLNSFNKAMEWSQDAVLIPGGVNFVRTPSYEETSQRLKNYLSPDYINTHYLFNRNHAELFSPLNRPAKPLCIKNDANFIYVTYYTYSPRSMGYARIHKLRIQKTDNRMYLYPEEKPEPYPEESVCVERTLGTDISTLPDMVINYFNTIKIQDMSWDPHSLKPSDLDEMSLDDC
jgi:hypothetical protein